MSPNEFFAEEYTALHDDLEKRRHTVTTTQTRGHKRPHDSSIVEDSTSDSSCNESSPEIKHTRLGEQTFQDVFESEYQGSTSSQRDQEFDEEDSMTDEDSAQHYEDETDNDESYDMEVLSDQEQDEESEGQDIDDERDLSTAEAAALSVVIQ